MHPLYFKEGSLEHWHFPKANLPGDCSLACKALTADLGAKIPRKSQVIIQKVATLDLQFEKSSVLDCDWQIG